MRLKPHMSVRSAVLVAVMAVLPIATFIPVGAMATSTKSVPVAHSACHHFAGATRAPCVVGNVLVECGFRFGACEYQKYLRCTMSAEKGKIVHFIEDPNGPIIGTRLENVYKIVTCKGSATILKVYVDEGRTRSWVYQLVGAHGAHSLTVTLYYRSHGFRDDGLLIMAQH
jgi:hypothetical protein